MTATAGWNKFQPRSPTFGQYQQQFAPLSDNAPNILLQGFNRLEFTYVAKRFHITTKK